jgi:large subunit ribosomal protein L18|tara:strand:- start:4874 stop:5461 length:588 start_codon:yes stop_codon:yes gene_type:complete
MKKSSIYTVQFKRKREGTTNYRKRLKILASNKPRLVIRKSLKNIQAAIIDYDKKGDVVKASAHSSDLKKFGWCYGAGNLPAAYLVGFLLGKRTGEKSNDAVLDIGLNKSVKGSRVYAVLAGALDAGMKVPCSKEILPSSERLIGKHIIDYGEKLKKDETSFKKQFGTYIKDNNDPSNITKKLEEVKNNIDKKPTG